MPIEREDAERQARALEQEQEPLQALEKQGPMPVTAEALQQLGNATLADMLRDPDMTLAANVGVRREVYDILAQRVGVDAVNKLMAESEAKQVASLEGEEQEATQVAMNELDHARLVVGDQRIAANLVPRNIEAFDFDPGSGAFVMEIEMPVDFEVEGTTIHYEKRITGILGNSIITNVEGITCKGHWFPVPVNSLTRDGDWVVWGTFGGDEEMLIRALPGVL
jgi:hypothetical protein